MSYPLTESGLDKEDREGLGGAQGAGRGGSSASVMKQSRGRSLMQVQTNHSHSACQSETWDEKRPPVFFCFKTFQDFPMVELWLHSAIDSGLCFGIMLALGGETS
jgi:hypothetical protein